MFEALKARIRELEAECQRLTKGLLFLLATILLVSCESKDSAYDRGYDEISAGKEIRSS